MTIPAGADLKAVLSSCDREPIHIPGSVQRYGVLLHLHNQDLRVLQVSENVGNVAGIPATAVLQAELSRLLDPESVEKIANLAAAQSLENAPQYLPPLRTVSGRLMEAILHRSQGALLLQLEPSDPSAGEFHLSLLSSLQSVVGDLTRTKSIREFCQRAAEQVRRFTGFDRVMIYRFLEDESGQVIAEDKRADIESFLGLHYPASDIPTQARALYVKSPIRFIVDVNASPAALVPLLNPLTNQPLDLSYAALRSVSPVHVEYLKNMGVVTSFSISIVVQDRLWGLVACHHLSPKIVPHAQRMACEFLAQTLSAQMDSKQYAERQTYLSRIARVQDVLVSRMSIEEPFSVGLLKSDTNILHLIESGGAAVCMDGAVETLGRVPQERQIATLVDWLGRNVPSHVFSSDSLVKEYPPASEFMDTAAGVLGLRLGFEKPEFILWFRPEIKQLVSWGGNPNKPVEVAGSGEMELRPRRSFAIWQEEVEAKSKPWQPFEFEAAAQLRRSIVEVILRRLEQLSHVNEQLRKSNVELDSFAYAASHDLREPLRGIQAYTGQLGRAVETRLSDDERTLLSKVRAAAQRMDTLVEGLLEYSRVGRAEFAMQRVDLNGVARRAIELLQSYIDERNAHVRIVGKLPDCVCDRGRITAVFQNLIANGIRYNRSTLPTVEIGVLPASLPTIFVRDNGIGIPQSESYSIYDIFRRLPEAEEFGAGSGAGLTITRKVIERHGGNIWFESEVGKGTTFFFTLPPASQTPPPSPDQANA